MPPSQGPILGLVPYKTFFSTPPPPRGEHPDTQATLCPLGYFTLNLLECIHSFIELLYKEHQQIHEGCLSMLR